MVGGDTRWRRVRPGLARGISAVVNPPAVLFVLFVALVWRHGAPPQRTALWLGICLGFGALLPVGYVGVLKHRKRVEGFFVADRALRLRPLLVGSSSCLVGLVLLGGVSAPSDVRALMLCAACNGLLMAAITTRWKVSLHAAGAGGALAVLVFLFGLPGFFPAPAALAVCWARVEAGAHTPAQVAAGAVLAFLATWAVFPLVAGPFSFG